MPPKRQPFSRFILLQKWRLDNTAGFLGEVSPSLPRQVASQMPLQAVSFSPLCCLVRYPLCGDTPQRPGQLLSAASFREIFLPLGSGGNSLGERETSTSEAGFSLPQTPTLFQHGLGRLPQDPAVVFCMQTLGLCTRHTLTLFHYASFRRKLGKQRTALRHDLEQARGAWYTTRMKRTAHAKHRIITPPLQSITSPVAPATPRLLPHGAR